MTLIVASLVLLSLHFGESDSGPLHGAQRGVASLLAPLEDVANRALKPGRDAINWFDDTFKAKGENEDLKAEVASLRGQLAKAQGAEGQNDDLRKLLGIDKSPAVAEYDPVTASVIGRSPTIWYSTVTIGAGSSSGVEVNDAVIAADGLVGKISAVAHSSAQVELITDHRNAVSAKALPDGPEGIIEPEAGDPSTLLLDFIDSDQKIKQGDDLVTAGWSDGRISSAYPPGLLIGKVSQSTPDEQDSSQSIHVEPYVDMRELDEVQVLTGGPTRPGVPK
ncbi:rod shape-determining protein MreC [soil metagenome]